MEIEGIKRRDILFNKRGNGNDLKEDRWVNNSATQL